MHLRKSGTLVHSVDAPTEETFFFPNVRHFCRCICERFCSDIFLSFSCYKYVVTNSILLNHNAYIMADHPDRVIHERTAQHAFVWYERMCVVSQVTDACSITTNVPATPVP